MAVALNLATLLVALAACSTDPASNSSNSGALSYSQSASYTGAADVPRSRKPFLHDPDNFQFAVVSDRTGGHRPGVFEKAMQQVNLLQPEFVMCVGDLIEGYSEDTAELNRQWDELDSMVGVLQMPFFYTVGNHDISNNLMRDLWHQRLGRDYYHFVYKNVLFLSLNTEDPPIQLSEQALAGQARLAEMMKKDPEGAQQSILQRARQRVPGGPKPQPSEVAISDAQLDYVARVLQENPDVRWTFLFMHKPAWDTENAQFRQIESLLATRPYTMIAGHEHYYSYTQRSGRDYLSLGTTGGIWVNQGAGNLDHITWITMASDGPVIANLRLDGILDKHGPE